MRSRPAPACASIGVVGNDSEDDVSDDGDGDGDRYDGDDEDDLDDGHGDDVSGGAGARGTGRAACAGTMGVMRSRGAGVPAWMGQVRPGCLDRRVLDQDRFWVTREAQVLELSAMSTEHLRAVAELLRGKAMVLHMHAMGDLLDEASEDAVVGEVLALALGGASIADLEAEEWLETTPLMRAIERETHRR